MCCESLCINDEDDALGKGQIGAEGVAEPVVARKVDPTEWRRRLGSVSGGESGIVDGHGGDGAVFGKRAVAQDVEDGSLTNGGSVSFGGYSEDEDCVAGVATREKGG